MTLFNGMYAIICKDVMPPSINYKATFEKNENRKLLVNTVVTTALYVSSSSSVNISLS
jgi:hypothetical protein